MNEEQDKIKGRIKQAAGDLTGDEELQQEGEADEKAAEAKSKVGEKLDQVKEKADDLIDRARNAVGS